MKAAVVPKIDSQWEVKEVPAPEPGPNQVLIKIHASGLCFTDVHQTRGEIPGAFPRTLGHEPAGEIVCRRHRCSHSPCRGSSRRSMGPGDLWAM